ncbi:MAG: DNA polymerase Y family protein, partial [Candidatus Rokubacteria bacterium]|nr:DNA polymerase Y family protein [Candidatus Rokubacteria bacterium]
MDRLACVNLPAFPLQLLLWRHPEWATHPVAVVVEDKPQGLILWVNEKARQAGVLPGLRYVAGSSLALDLRAGVVPSGEIAAEVAALTERLMRFTPEVEPASEEPGVFWLDAAGLDFLCASLEEWARSIAVDLGSAGFNATMVVGFTRFGTYAVARAREGIVVFEDSAHERASAEQVQLDRLNLNPDLRDLLSQLEVKTVGALLSLPPGGLHERFGPEIYR